MSYRQLAEDIIKHIGTEKNVHSLVHCATRLRFTLNDRSKADKAAIEKLNGVVTVMESGGQFQVVIGNTVPEVYKEIGEFTNLLNDSNQSSDRPSEQSTSLFGKFVDIVSGIFTPLLGVMAGAGILKGLLGICINAKWLTPEDTTYQILFAASDSLFYFLPLLLAFTSARKFKANPFVAVTIAGALIYPSIQELAKGGGDVSFFGIPVVLMSYTSTVIPIILAVFVMSYIERFFNKVIHESVKNFITPLILLVTIVPLTLIIFGPFGVYAGNGIAAVILKVFSFSPTLAGALIAMAWQILVIFGIHWGLVPVILNNIAVHGKDHIKPATAPAVFSQAGASIGVMLKTKNKKLKTLAGSTAVSAVFGITEPAVYGVTLRLKKPFIAAVISAGVGGAIIGYSQSVAIASGLPSLLTLPIFYGQGFTGFLIGISVSFVLSIVLTYLIGFKDPVDEDEAPAPVVPKAENEHGVKAEHIKSPLKGEVVKLEEVEDKAFSSGALGQGAAIIPTEGKLFAPVTGEVTTVFPTGHAYGLTSESGAEILIHIGLDTVQLGGQHFTPKVVQGQKVVEGELLAEFDIEAIQNEGLLITTPVIITNSDQFSDIIETEEKQTKPGQSFLHLL
ncbi:beta-glucoside-specific PTS transporter subunit IIABC [Bacillus sp. NPDC077027]|uniref:beta-glucoside-specific PTS transporter subunit IIABC n=1 Tax=Bacillus sp. NPDC077027 TaxID=3390548 RepID=UPI003CFBF381